MKEKGHDVIIQEGATGQFELFSHKGTNYNFNEENWISFMKESDGVPKFFTLHDVEPVSYTHLTLPTILLV